MPTLASSLGDRPVKLMLIGASGTGKTGALTSLVKAGYTLRVLDFDNGLDALAFHVQDECPKRLDQIGYMSFRDRKTMTPMGPVVQGQAKAAVNGVKALDKWEDESKPSEWGLETVFVLDSLTHFGRAALDWAKGANPSFKDPRLWYAPAQQLVMDVLAGLTDPSFRTHVIVITHIDYRELVQGEGEKGYPSSIGGAAGPKLASFFNTLLLCETSGTGTNLKRVIKTVPTPSIDVKNPAPKLIQREYPIGDGLASIFKTLRQQPNAA